MADPSSEGLRVERVTVRFGGLTALDEVSFEARRGEIVGVIGPNGAGKTTVFNVICGFLRPTSGSIWLDGRRLQHHHPHDLTRLGIARTLQGVGLCAGLSTVENVMTGAQARVRADLVSGLLGAWRSSREETTLRERAHELLDRLHIARYADAYPSMLPYGIRKRAALARALFSEPTMLLLDEPASGLSSDDMDELSELLRSLRSTTGVVLVEHHMDLVMSLCDRLVVLDFGRVIAAGPPDEIRDDPEVTTAYLGEAVQELPSETTAGGDVA
ncbi:MAG TPA: ABC transporter ATP-binding protein [Acidimicrobiales bacterium]|nr:ABC transporter ATP-binding protein [Acidimicrobiales bacterium]